MDTYRQRIADILLKYRLEEMGAVLIEGPKWCGKTTTAEQQAKSVLYMADPDNQKQYVRLASLKISTLLKGITPRLIDEWQIVPQIWDAIRFEVDHRQQEGQFILTGSAVPASTGSKTAIRSADTRYFVDPSIAVASLGLGPGDLINDLETFGLLFETLCVRDLRVYADALEGQVYHYRDKNGLECDAVIHLRNGKYGLVEIKLGGDDAIEHGANTLNNLSNKIDTTKMKEPSFKMVLTATGKYAYKRQDGVLVVPVTCLKD